MTLTFNPYFKLKLIDLSDDTQVNAGGTNEQNLQPDAGKIYHIVDLFVNIPDAVGSTANDHRLYCYRKNLHNNHLNYIWYISSNTGTDIKVEHGYFYGTSIYPTAAGNIQLLIHDLLICDNTDYLIFHYDNNLDANQTGTRTIKAIVKEYLER